MNISAENQKNIIFEIKKIKTLYRCSYPQCSSKFREKGNLITHTRIHTGERPFKCNFSQCNRAFITLGNLKSHYSNHTGDKPFKCEINGCSKKYNRHCRLKIHQRTHQGIKPFKCNFKGCGKSFNEKGNFKTHYRIHTGEKPFICDYLKCNMAFKAHGHLKDHKKRHFNIRPYECSFCHSKFARSSTLKIHLNTHGYESKTKGNFQGIENCCRENNICKDFPHHQEDCIIQRNEKLKLYQKELSSQFKLEFEKNETNSLNSIRNVIQVDREFDPSYSGKIDAKVTIEKSKIANFMTLNSKHSTQSSVKHLTQNSININDNLNIDQSNNLLKELIKNKNIQIEPVQNTDQNTVSDNKMLIDFLNSSNNKEVNHERMKELNDFINYQCNHQKINIINNVLNNTNLKKNFSPYQIMNYQFINQMYYLFNTSPKSDQIRYLNSMLYSDMQTLSQNDFITNRGPILPNAAYLNNIITNQQNLSNCLNQNLNYETQLINNFSPTFINKSNNISTFNVTTPYNKILSNNETPNYNLLNNLEPDSMNKSIYFKQTNVNNPSFSELVNLQNRKFK